MDNGLQYWRNVLALPDEVKPTSASKSDRAGKVKFKNQLISNGYDERKAEEISVRCANEYDRKNRP